MDNCVFCSQLREAAGRAPWNVPILETENFVVVPSLGALVDGWSLLLPKAHFLSMGALPQSLQTEAVFLQRQIEERLRSTFGQSLTIFEHGPSAGKHNTGCGVDHAHLHILPGDFDLVSLARPFVPLGAEWLEGDWDERSVAFKAGLDYLFVKQEGMPGLLAVAAEFESQVLRKAIAFQIGSAAEFNWRDFPRHDRAIDTGNLLRRRALDQIEEHEHVA
jgi:ATP adenylyltransferase